MNWIRKGKLFDNKTWDIPWHKLNTQLPIPYLKNEDTLRLFVTFCDEFNRGRLGYVDVNPDNPAELLGYSEMPILDLGRRGCFDENGVVTTSLWKENGKLYAYYCGFQKHVNYPYSSLAGIAVSEDGGETFYRIKETPLLERTDGEMFIRTGVGIYKYDKVYRLYYAAGNEWISVKGKTVPKYSLRYIDSDDLTEFSGKSKQLFPLRKDEYGMTSPQIWKREDETYEMFYSVRTESTGYHMGYAISADGRTFERHDEKMEFERPTNDFDSEMVCYGKCFKRNNRVYLFYSGNHFGMEGIGWAEADDEKDNRS